MSQGFSPERRPRGAAFVIAAMLAGLAAVLFWDAASLTQDGGYAGVGPADVPRLIAWGLLGLAALTVVSGLRGDLPAAMPQAPAPLLWILAGLGLQLALLHVAGFAIAGALLFGFTARAFGQRPLWRNVLVGFVLAFGIFAVFDQVMKLNLPGGPLERLVFGG
jgi:putative tricarboxylic transport membrane protein